MCVGDWLESFIVACAVLSIPVAYSRKVLTTMLILSGIVVSHGKFTPAPTTERPNPVTYHNVNIEGVSVSVADQGVLQNFPIGKEVSVPITANRGQGGFKFSHLPVSLQA
jgi:hypothetical protein